jgi:hypothetical protein
MSMRKFRPSVIRALAVCGLALAGILVQALPGAAAAGTDASSDRVKLAYVQAVHGQPQRISKQDFVANSPAKTPGVARAVATATSCWYLDDYRYGKNIFGGTLFTFHTRTNWCGDGSWIRSYAYTDADASTVVGWKYYGLTQNYDQYGVNWNQFRSVRQGQFCIINCIGQNVYETIDVLVGPAGQVYRS